MEISLYSLLMAIFWSSLFIVLLFFCRRNNRLILHWGLAPLIILVVGSVVRCFLPLDIYFFTKTISCPGIFSDIVKLVAIPTAENPFTVADFLGVAWGIVSLFLLLRTLVRYRRYIKRIDSLEELDDGDIYAYAKNVAKEKNISKFAVYCTSSVRAPFVVGLKFPRILLPNLDYTEVEYSYIFLHEFTHWKNRDLWVKLIIEVLCDFFWWNPLVYLLKKDLSQTLEIKCDLAVVGEKDDSKKIEYLDTIIKTIRYSPTREEKLILPYSVAELSGDSAVELLQRTKVTLDYNCRRKPSRLFMPIVTTAMLACFVFSYAFVFHPSYEPPLDEINVDGCVEIKIEDMYLIKNKDGSYSIYDYGVFAGILSAESAQIYIEDGIEIKSEG